MNMLSKKKSLQAKIGPTSSGEQAPQPASECRCNATDFSQGHPRPGLGPGPGALLRLESRGAATGRPGKDLPRREPKGPLNGIFTRSQVSPAVTLAAQNKQPARMPGAVTLRLASLA